MWIFMKYYCSDKIIYSLLPVGKWWFSKTQMFDSYVATWSYKWGEGTKTVSKKTSHPVWCSLNIVLVFLWKCHRVKIIYFLKLDFKVVTLYRKASFLYLICVCVSCSEQFSDHILNKMQRGWTLQNSINYPDTQKISLLASLW